MSGKRDPLRNYLTDLNGQYFQFEGGCYARFVFNLVPESQRKPHGFAYSLTLHRKDGGRIVGFDNAHAAPKGRGPAAKSRQTPAYDHKHVGDRTLRYEYKDLSTLLDDFWDEVEKALARE